MHRALLKCDHIASHKAGLNKFQNFKRRQSGYILPPKFTDAKEKGNKKDTGKNSPTLSQPINGRTDEADVVPIQDGILATKRNRTVQPAETWVDLGTVRVREVRKRKPLSHSAFGI